MAIDCATTPYGPPAHRALAAAAEEAKAGDPLAPVTVVVPTNYVGLAARRALGRSASGGRTGAAAVDFVTVYGLAERLGAALGRCATACGTVNRYWNCLTRAVMGMFEALEHVVSSLDMQIDGDRAKVTAISQPLDIRLFAFEVGVVVVGIRG